MTKLQQVHGTEVLLGLIAPVSISLLRLTASQEAPCDRVERVELDAVMLQAREEHKLDSPVKGVVSALIDLWSDYATWLLM